MKAVRSDLVFAAISRAFRVTEVRERVTRLGGQAAPAVDRPKERDAADRQVDEQEGEEPKRFIAPILKPNEERIRQAVDVAAGRLDPRAREARKQLDTGSFKVHPRALQAPFERPGQQRDRLVCERRGREDEVRRRRDLGGGVEG
jgi:hypothetical protein